VLLLLTTVVAVVIIANMNARLMLNDDRYIFTSPEALIDDFWNDVKKWRF